MKQLTNIKLINWHRFVDTDLENFGRVNLLTGENGSGKTTILDAIQYVLLASSKSFNSAAHLNGKRKVTTYVRSKTGKENDAFERKGAVTSHIALEFYEESTKEYFVLGAVIDSLSETQETTVRYLLNGKRIEDIVFVDGQKPLSIKEFKKRNNINGSNFFRTAKSAKLAIANRLGRLENRFFELIPKSISFKPIDNIKDFVFTYVLDEKGVDVEELQDIVLSYTDLETVLKNARQRLSELEDIKETYERYQKFLKQNQKYNYYVTRGENDKLDESIRKAEHELTKLHSKIQEVSERIKKNEQDKLSNKRLIDDLRLELNNNEAFRALENQKDRLKNLEIELTNTKTYIDQLRAKNQEAINLLKELKKSGIENKHFRELEKVSKDLFNLNEVADAEALFKLVIRIKKDEEESLRNKRYEKKAERDALKKELNDVINEIELLEHNQRSYPKNTKRLYEALKREFQDDDTSPYILCEVLEIDDESWRNAVEGYLNTQRFYIIVDPEYYDRALAVYDRLRAKKRLYGVGLINAAKLQAYDIPQKETLAQVVTSKNIYARRYINWLLGRVHLCKDKNDLKNYKAAITKNCLKYQNRVLSAIKPDIYETPWIGERSYAVQLKKAREKKAELEGKIAPIEDEIRKIERNIKLLNTEPDEYILHNLNRLTTFNRLNDEIAECKRRIKELEKDQTILDKQKQLKRLEDIQNNLELKGIDLYKEQGKLTERINHKEDSLTQFKSRYKEAHSKLEMIESEASSELESWQKDYKKSLRDKSYDDFLKNYGVMITKATNQREDARNDLVSLMQNYNREHNFGAPTSVDGFKEYERAYQKLKQTEILEYEEKVLKAKEKAEEEFKEQFISRLQENIKEAQLEFRQLNSALKDITFNGEHYHFTSKPSREKRAYYDMIMDPEAVGISIFSGSFFEKHKEEIEDLFNQLTQDDDETYLEELMDYRNYLDFDIQITHEDGSFSLYSKVSQEKSGGETQTPFYVAIAASFVQLYRNTISKDEAIGLIMFDEAFNNMDDERIAGVLSFIRKLPLQVLIAAPTDRTQYILPYTDETFVIYREGKRNHAARHGNDNLLDDIQVEFEVSA